MSGTRHLSTWEGRSTEEWRARWGLPALVALAETGSTNDIARRMAEQGAPAGLLVMTEHQTAGRGRMSRTWSDAPGKSLLMSFLLRPRSGPHGRAPGTAPLRVGLAVATALRDSAGLDARIKWPNDIVVDERKVAGILCEAVSTGGDTILVAGIGINVHQTHDEWPEGLEGRATSIALSVPGRDTDRGAVMDAIVGAVRPLFTTPLAPLDNDELRAFGSLDALHGSVVTVTPAGTAASTPKEGVAAGIATDGALLLESGGSVHRVTSGTVRSHGSRTQRTAPGR